MSEKLNNLVDNYIEQREKELFSPDIEQQNKDLFISATKEKLIKTIQDEVKTEVREEALLEAEEIINERAGLKKIEEFKKLTKDGFIVAIFVGLFVNQCTDAIGILKGSITVSSIWPTVVLAGVFLFACIVIFGWLFVSELIKLLKGKTNNETN